MKKIFYFLFMLTTLAANANGVMIVDASSPSYFDLVESNVSVEVSNQVATVTSHQTFVNLTGAQTSAKYGFPMPATGTAIQLRWRIDNDWKYASFAAEEQDTTLPGGGGNNSATHPDLRTYLGTTPLYFEIQDPVPAGGNIEVEVQYVELLDYYLDKVTFNYPSDYSLIKSGAISGLQNFSFHLYSERTVVDASISGVNGTVSTSQNEANISYFIPSSPSIDDITIEYELASDELGVISFSTFITDSTFNCDGNGNGFLGLVIEPESNETTDVIEKVFTLVIDESGSMSGNKMTQAKEAAEFITNNLNAGDYFNIIVFDSQIRSFRSTHVEFNPTTQQDALDFISEISAGGLTNISGALTTAINQFSSSNSEKANIILFFTDGEASSGITSTDGILNAVDNAVQSLGFDVFIFTFGIGNNINQQMLTQLAHANSGLSAFVSDQDLQQVISEFYLTVRNPVLLNTEITVSPDIVIETYPNPLPNLYKGMQLILTGRYDVAQTIDVTLSGTAFNQQVSYTYTIDLPDTAVAANAFLPKLWAKTKIENLESHYNSLSASSNEAIQTKEAIEDISMCYQVISQFTSFEDNTDDTQILGLFGDEEVEDADEYNFSFYPNPFKNDASLNITLDMGAEILVHIYDAEGNLIKTITQMGYSGPNSILWDGMDMSLNPVEEGIYFYSIAVGEKSYTGRIVKN